MAEKLSITLPAEMVSVINGQVKQGRFASVSEVLREATRTWVRQEDEHAERIASIRSGIDQSLTNPRPVCRLTKPSSGLSASTNRQIPARRPNAATPSFLREEAIADLGEIYDFIVANGGLPEVAIGFVRRIHTRCEKISHAPEGGTPRPDVGNGVRLVPFEKSAVVAYRVDDDAIEVLKYPMEVGTTRLL